MIKKQRDKSDGDGNDSGARVRTAAYIAELVKEMEHLANRAQIKPLEQFLRVAREEAKRIALSA